MKRATTLLVLSAGLLVALGLVTLYSAENYTRARSFSVSPGHLIETNLAVLGFRLQTQVDPVAAFVAGRLSPIGEWAVTEAVQPKRDIKAVRRMLADDFTQIVNGPLIYDPVLFSQVPLRQETRMLLEKKPTDQEVAQANRLLLEDAFPVELSRKHSAGNFKNQLGWAVLGLVVGLLVVAVDYRRLKDCSWLIYLLAIVLLVLVFVPGIGIRRNGASRWLNLFVGNFQPSEFAKLALIIVLAHYAEVHRRQIGETVRGLVVPGLLVLPLLALVLREPDFGTTILLVLVTASLLVLAGASWRGVVGSGALFAVGISVLIFQDPVRLKRLISFWYLEENKSGVGYQVWQGIVALASGGWTGLGLGDGLQKLGFVPENQTDFILSVIGEELGLVATLGVVVAYMIFVTSGLFIAAQSRDRFGFLLGAGISFLIGFQAFINIGVVTSFLPNKGLPLPFVSYGGSSLLMMLVALGILLSISRHSAVTETASTGVLGDRELAAT